MERVEIVEGNSIVVLQANVNRELRGLNGTLVDIKYAAAAVGSHGAMNYSAMILYKTN